jgi:4-hydroxybenzoate polyprenyltransferase
MYRFILWSKTTLSGLVKEMRPWQWYKQSIVLVGLVFSGSLFNYHAVIHVLLTVIAFSFVAGSVYIFNDIVDVEEDRNHPQKRHRPIASGQVGIPLAVVFGLGVGFGGLVLASTVHYLVLLALLGYVANNVLYNAVFKEVLFVDVLTIAVGFVLRALAGVYAVQTSLQSPSPWLIVCTLLAALMLGFGKRYQEMRITDGVNSRTSLEEYHSTVLEQLLGVITATLLMSYSLYTFFGTTQSMMVTLPFAYFATFRFHHLLFITTNSDSIERLLLLDREFLVNLALWVTAIVVVIYAEQSVAGIV